MRRVSCQKFHYGQINKLEIVYVFKSLSTKKVPFILERYLNPSLYYLLVIRSQTILTLSVIGYWYLFLYFNN